MHVSWADVVSFNKGKEQQTTQNLFLFFSVAPDTLDWLVEPLNIAPDEGQL